MKLTPNDGSSAFEELAERYAAEMSAQFRTLSLFVEHAGEVGRSHEVFLADMLARFLPGKLRIGTGFVHSRAGVTRQQDIIVYDWQKLPLPFQVGECIVADSDAVAATVEVKTSLSSTSQVYDSLTKIMADTDVRCGGIARGVYAWEGVDLERAVNAYWEVIRAANEDVTRFTFPPLPSFLYVRGQYILVLNSDGRINSAPLRVMRIGPDNTTEGHGLLALLDCLWLHGVQMHVDRPWWLWDWIEKNRKHPNDRYEEIGWPSDLQVRADEIQAIAENESARRQP